MRRRYVPDRGDVVWINLDPQWGREQLGRRPALVVSPVAYNRKVGLAIFCPITSRVKGYPFEVGLPKEAEISGVVLSDQIRSLDWQARQVELIFKAPKGFVAEVLSKVTTLLS